ncbi:MAG: 6-pyruvoyl tetrahydropterin synthase [Euryarchaeota archaeon]|nr:6-pyruvoyl tetrahydropterin synthase [Euryarchaeota archaeon]
MKAESYTSTKTYRNLPCAHRQWKNDGHCSFIHGYSREFIFHFACNELDKHGWVVDFGGLKELKEFLENWFDHTLIIAEDDPLISDFKKLEEKGGCDLRILKEASIEFSAKFVYEFTNKLISQKTNQRAWCYRVEVRENDKNSAIYQP